MYVCMYALLLYVLLTYVCFFFCNAYDCVCM